MKFIGLKSAFNRLAKIVSKGPHELSLTIKVAAQYMPPLMQIRIISVSYD